MMAFHRTGLSLLIAATSISKSVSYRLHHHRIPLKWQKAVQSIPAEKILPLDWGGEREQAYAAWKGDALLKAAAVHQMTLREGNNSSDSHFPSTKGSATQLISLAVSNAFLASHRAMLLPDYVDRMKGWSDHQVGTMVEAAVAHVQYSKPSTSTTSYKDEILQDLVAFLIDTALTTPDIPAAKGRLIQLGGSVTSERVGGSDHQAIFQAQALCSDGLQTKTAVANSKKKAEQLAAAHLLQEMEDKDFLSFSPEEDEEIVELPPSSSSSDWNKDNSLLATTSDSTSAIGVNDHQQVIRLRDGVTLEQWWMAGATVPKKALRRALFAPVVFPESIAAVDSWTRKAGGGATFILITSKHTTPHQLTPVCSGVSVNKSRQAAGLAANQLIAQIVGIPLEGK